MSQAAPPTTPPLAAERPRVAIVLEQLWQPIPGGSGTYIRELVGALAQQHYPLVGCGSRHRTPLRAHGLPPIPYRGSRLPRTALYESWNRLGAPLAESLVPGAEVVHATTWAIPPTRMPLVVTVHDVAFLRSPEHFTPRGNRFFRRCLERTIAEAERIIVPSRTTADDAIDAGCPASRIEVIPHGVRTVPVDDGDVSRLRERIACQRPYILWVGTIEPRKNLDGVLAAYELLRSRDGQEHTDLDLVIVGPQGWGDHAALSAAIERIGHEHIHLTGHISDHDLAAAYRGARAFVFPSLWEGFGLPVLESMAYGTPVVTSQGTSMSDVAQDAALYCDPHDADSIARALALAVGPAHDDYTARGLERAAQLTWEENAAAHMQVYAQAAATHTPVRSVR